MKRKVILLGILILIVSGFLIYYLLIHSNEDPKVEGGTAYEIVEKMNSTYPMNTVLYGDDLPLFDNHKCTKINRITEQDITTDLSKYKRTVLIINNLSGTASLSQEEIEIIEKVWAQKNLDIFSLGMPDTVQLYETSIFPRKKPEEGGPFGLDKVLYEGKMTEFRGMYESSNLNSLSFTALRNALYESTILTIGECIESNN